MYSIGNENLSEWCQTFRTGHVGVNAFHGESFGFHQQLLHHRIPSIINQFNLNNIKPSQQEYRRISKNIGQYWTISENLFWLSRIQQGGLNVVPENYDHSPKKKKKPNNPQKKRKISKEFPNNTFSGTENRTRDLFNLTPNSAKID